MRNRATTPLKRPKIRQSWSKYNLYNLAQLRLPFTRPRNFFQQKWKAKSDLRAYHGEQVSESQWQKMFRRRLHAVLPMDARYLAANDGSVESAGRGSGVELEKKPKGQKNIPYMLMTFAPLERRLDTAVFRSMFASSARQARQFVLHGAVKVNGQKMRFPGYQLNPGDMFQVDTERVMYATGVPKGLPVVEGEEAAPVETEEPVAVEKVKEEEVAEDRDPREVLKELKAQAKSILTKEKTNISAKRKQDLRAFSKAVKRTLSQSKSSTIFSDSLEAQFLELQNQLKIQREKKKTEERNEEPTSPAQSSLSLDSADELSDDVNYVSDEEYNDLFNAFSESADNPIDDSKPYATPWMPRDFMGAFAFIPRYLEVNHNICAAVYLRHPVARPGQAEVPTPWDEGTSGTAFTWYLRRR